MVLQNTAHDNSETHERTTVNRKTRVWLINILFHNRRHRLLCLVWHTFQILRPGTPPRIFLGGVVERWLRFAAQRSVKRSWSTVRNRIRVSITEPVASYFLHTHFNVIEPHHKTSVSFTSDLHVFFWVQTVRKAVRFRRRYFGASALLEGQQPLLRSITEGRKKINFELFVILNFV